MPPNPTRGPMAVSGELALYDHLVAENTEGNMRFVLFCIALGLLTAMTTPSMAAYGGLILIPTADTTGKDEYSVSLGNQGPTHAPNLDSRYLNTEIGIGDRFETGIDFDLSKGGDTAAATNFKYAFLTDPKLGLFMAAGIGSVDEGVKPQPFLVATQCLRLGRIHFGGIRTEQRNRWFVGADTSFSDKWTFMADYTGGDENGSSLGINYQVNDNFGVCVGFERPHADDGERSYVIEFVFGGSFRKR